MPDFKAWLVRQPKLPRFLETHRTVSVLIQLTRILINIYTAGTMYICVCHGITERQIRDVLDDGATSLVELQRNLPVGSCCGRCLDTAHELLSEHRQGSGGCTPGCAG